MRHHKRYFDGQLGRFREHLTRAVRVGCGQHGCWMNVPPECLDTAVADLLQVKQEVDKALRSIVDCLLDHVELPEERVKDLYTAFREDAQTRSAVACHPSCPDELRKVLAQDGDGVVAEHARLTIAKKSQQRTDSE